MEHSYWLARKRASAANARRADSARARLVHLDLAGRYSIEAAVAARRSAPAAAAGALIPLTLPAPSDAGYYDRLEQGARWLASRAPDGVERDGHLGNANRYARLKRDSVPGRKR